MSAFQLAILLFEGALTVGVGYLLLLTAAAWRGQRSTPAREGQPTHRFLFAIPAHNAEKLLPGLLLMLEWLRYPRSLYEVHVIADNCSDRTARVAREYKAVVHEQNDPARQGKAQAVQYLLERVCEAGVPYDAVVILDADSLVSQNFLEVMDARLALGERVIQGYCAVRHPGHSWSTGLRFAGLALLHYLRPLGRMALGSSAGLQGNGMVFAADVLHKRRWESIPADETELHMELLLSGERVTFAPDAVVTSEMPDSLQAARPQVRQWEVGRLRMARRYVPQLLREASAIHRPGWSWRRAFQLADATMEHLIPPASVLALLSITSLAAAQVLVLPSRRQAGAGSDRASVAHYRERARRHRSPVLVLGLGAIFGQIVYTFAGLRLARAPFCVYRSLFYAPVLIFWKGWLYLRALGKLPQRVTYERRRWGLS